MSYEDPKGLQRPREQASQPAQAASQSVIAPGKRTWTQSLPSGLAGTWAPVQRKPDPVPDAARQEQAELTARWIDTAIRPDLYPPPVQRKSEDSAAQPAGDIHHLAAQGTSGSATALPHIDRIQEAFGEHDVRGISAHVGGPAADACHGMNAVAYASGERIAFASTPDLHTAAHEAAHVVQQRRGVSLATGVGETGDQYEQHADTVADAVVAGRPVAELLDPAGYSTSGAVQKQVQRQGPPEQNDDAAMDSADSTVTWRATGNLCGNPPVRDEEHPPNTDIVEDQTSYEQRLQAAIELQQNQAVRAESLLDAEGNVTDNRYWFARVYSLVTDREIQEAQEATFYYPSYVLQSVRYFEQIYANNFEAANEGGDVEEHWRQAFQVCADNEGLTWADVAIAAGMTGTGAAAGAGVGSMFGGGGAAPGAVVGGVAGLVGAPAAARAYAAASSLVASMLAHIRFDLPRAEAWVFQSYYQGQGSASIEDFLPDFNSMADVFEQATTSMNAEISERTGVPMEYLPRILQDLAMDLWFEANMATERADTWERAEMLAEGGLGGADPYCDEPDGTLEGNVVTQGDFTFGLALIPDASLRPTMEDPATHLSDSEIREDVEVSGKEDLAQRRTSARVTMLRRLVAGVTWNDDETTIMRVLEASRIAGDVVSTIDGANAWDLCYAVDGDEFKQLQPFLVNHYYAATSQSMAFSLIRRCMDGETAEWEEQMIADILVERHGVDGRAIVTSIGRYYEDGGFADGLDKIQWQLDGEDQDRVDDLYASAGGG